jgi:hypothetical protein
MLGANSMLGVLISCGIDPTTAGKEVVTNYKLVDNATSNGHSTGRFVELTTEGVKTLCGEVPAPLQILLDLGVKIRFIEADNSYVESKSSGLASIIEQMKVLG